MGTLANPSRTACFSIHAEAEPSVMPRVLDQFAKRGLVPDQWHSSCTEGCGSELVIDIQICALGPELVRSIAEALRRIVHVDQVLTAEKSP